MNKFSTLIFVKNIKLIDGSRELSLVWLVEMMSLLLELAEDGLLGMISGW